MPRAAPQRELRRNLITIPAEEYDAFMTDMARRMRLNTPEELYAAIGYGGIQLSRLMIRIKDEVAKQAREAAPPAGAAVPIR